MEEFKGTKGKWVLKEQGNANEYCIMTDKMKWVSSFKLNGEQGREEQIANMLVFTAAPDLLEALIDLVNAYKESEDCERGPIDWNKEKNYPEILKAESAIKKALGL